MKVVKPYETQSYTQVCSRTGYTRTTCNCERLIIANCEGFQNTIIAIAKRVFFVFCFL